MSSKYKNSNSPNESGYESSSFEKTDISFYSNKNPSTNMNQQSTHSKLTLPSIINATGSAFKIAPMWHYIQINMLQFIQELNETSQSAKGILWI